MGFRFRRRVGPFNLSMSGVSLSLGGRGARFTIGPRGTRATVGLPGTGLFYSLQQGFGGGRGSRKKKRSAKPASTGPGAWEMFGASLVGWAENRLERERTKPRSDDERAFVDGLKALIEGNDAVAVRYLDKAAQLPDAAWLLGILLLKLQRPADAEPRLMFALEHSGGLGSLFDRFCAEFSVTLGITPEFLVHLRPSEQGTLLALLEIYQRQDRRSEAMWCADRLCTLDPKDPVTLLSVVELTLDDPGVDPAKRVVELTSNVENETPIHTAILLYKGRALMRLGLTEAAVKIFTSALPRGQGRSDELPRQIRYERALAYGLLGRKADSRRELERIYAEAPEFEDVGARLGLVTQQELGTDAAKVRPVIQQTAPSAGDPSAVSRILLDAKTSDATSHQTKAYAQAETPLARNEFDDSRGDSFWTRLGKTIIRSGVPMATQVLEDALKRSQKTTPRR